MNILWLGEKNCCDAKIVGAKSANLSSLFEDNNVPPGFVITNLSPNVINEASFNPYTPDFPEPLLTKLSEAYERLCGEIPKIELPLAVRSSSIAEDTKESSFAGQYETYLNVVGIENLGKAILTCMKSMTSERVITYRNVKGVPPLNRFMPVLVQKLIHAEVSAVVFSVNPITGNRNEVMINTNWGLGPSIVEGITTPDTYLVKKHPLEIQSHLIGEKKVMSAIKHNGITHIETPSAKQGVSSITKEQIFELTDLAIRLEESFGWAVDIECSYEDGKLYLIQCRPVTSI